MSNDRDNILSEIFDDALTLDNADKVSDLSPFEELEMNSEHYSNLEFFQQGGSKIIYKAYDTRTERKVALAQLPEEATELQVEAFLREARINAMLQHPNIVPVYDLGLRQSKPYFCMKFIDGKTLTDYIENSSDSNSDLLDVFLKICDATAYAHDRGILHLDLKPDNIRIDDFGDLRVCDWGLAQIIDGNEKIDKNFQKLEKYSFNKVDLDHKTIDGFIKGTPSFMAPEQTGLCKISKGPCTDTYALGCLLYFMLTKEQAFKGSLKDILDNTVKGIFPKPSKISSKVSSRIEAICLKAMSSDVEKRYQSVNEFKDDILAYRNGYITTAEEVNLFRLTKLFLKRNYLLSAIVFGFITVMMISIFIFIKSLKDSEEQALSAKNQAITSKGKAVKLAAQYLREKEENEAKGELLSEQFLENYKVAYEKYEFEDALEYINSAVKLNPANKEAWLSKADLHCIRFEFKEALNAYDQAGQEGALFGLASKYASFEGPVSVNLKLELISEAVKQFKLHRPSSDFVHSEVYSDLSIEDRVAFVKGVFSIFNPKQSSIHFAYDMSRKHLDISNNAHLRWGYCLQRFPAKSINMSKSGLTHFENIKSISLLELNASHTGISKFDALDLQNLRSLNISNTRIRDLTALSSSPIQELDISFCKVYGIHPLVSMRFLRLLRVHEGQFNKSQLSQLSKKVIVEFVD